MKEQQKFGADLYGPNGRIGGHIYITESELIWKPVLWGKAFSFPIQDVAGYVKKGSTLYLSVEGMEEFASFYTWSGQKIIDAIKKRNPNFRMLASNEYTRNSGCSFVLIGVILSVIGLIAAL